MKKNLSFISLLFVLLSVHIKLKSQDYVNYKALKVYTVSASGQIATAKGEVLGSIDKEGVVKDASGKKVAHIDAFNSTIDEETGEKLYKSDKDGNLLAVINKKVVNWKISPPETGVEVCLVRDKNNKIIASVHKLFKQQGPSALYFLMPKEEIMASVAPKPAAKSKTTAKSKKTTNTKKKKK